jgi:hypothetical protein
LKRKTAEVSSKAVLLEELLLHEGPARKDLAAYVSLSSDSLVKQPGDQAIPTPRLPEERRRSSCIRVQSDADSLFQ